MGTAIKHPVPDRVKPSFVIFDIRALWRSVNVRRVSQTNIRYLTFEKISPVRDCRSAPRIRGKIRLSKVGHPKFEVHVTPNENEYQKSVWTGYNLDSPLSWTIIIHHQSFDYVLNGGGDSLWSRQFLNISDLRDLDLDLGSGHSAYTVVYYSSTYTYTKFRSNQKQTFVDRLWVVRRGGRTLRPAYNKNRKQESRAAARKPRDVN